MILIVSDRFDSCADRVASILRLRGISAVRLVGGLAAEDLELVWREDGGANASMGLRGSRPFSLSSTTGVLLRSVMPFEAGPAFYEADAEQVRDELWSMLVAVWSGLPGRVLNPPFAVASARDPHGDDLDPALLAEAGFEYPETLVTCDEANARRFLDGCGRGAWIRGLRDAVDRRIDGDGAEDAGFAASLCLKPIRIRKIPSGRIIDVHVVGHCVVGWVDRSHERRVDPLPPVAGNSCVDLVRRMRLGYASVTVVLDHGRRPTCLDVNAVPGNERCPVRLQDSIASALADALAGTDG